MYVNCYKLEISLLPLLQFSKSKKNPDMAHTGLRARRWTLGEHAHSQCLSSLTPRPDQSAVLLAFPLLIAASNKRLDAA